MQLRSIFLDTRLDHDLNALKKVKQHLSDADLEPLGQSEKRSMSQVFEKCYTDF